MCQRWCGDEETITVWCGLWRATTKTLLRKEGISGIPQGKCYQYCSLRLIRLQGNAISKCQSTSISEATDSKEALWWTASHSFYLYQLTVGASKHMETQVDLLRLLFGVDFQIFYNDASNVYVLSWICWERARLTATTALDAYNIVSPIWGQNSSNLDSLWPLGDDIKEWKVVSE